MEPHVTHMDTKPGQMPRHFELTTCHLNELEQLFLRIYSCNIYLSSQLFKHPYAFVILIFLTIDTSVIVNSIPLY